jgi:glycine cleavage system H lipoate-binding protein
MKKTTEVIDEGKILEKAFGLIREAAGLIVEANRETQKIGLFVNSSFGMGWLFSVDRDEDNKLLNRLQTYQKSIERFGKVCKKTGPEEPARKTEKNHSSKRS